MSTVVAPWNRNIYRSHGTIHVVQMLLAEQATHSSGLNPTRSTHSATDLLAKMKTRFLVAATIR